MTLRSYLRPSPPLKAIGLFIAFFALAGIAPPAAAQDVDWRDVDNPYQEDIEYTIGETHSPRVEVENVRWRSFTIESPDREVFAVGETIETQLTLELENRGGKSAKVLIILLLEDEDGNPLDRIEGRPFKVAAGRLKERKETARFSGETLNSARRAYLFFEVLQ